MKTMTQEAFRAVPQLPQSQAGLMDQLSDLIFVAQRCGLYDAADHLKRLVPQQ